MTDKIIHYGIRSAESGEWLQFDNGQIFWTTSRAIAQAQLDHFLGVKDAKGIMFKIAEFD